MISENEFGKFSLYVGDLDSSVTENDLYNKFNAISEVSSIKICRDRNTGSSLGYAYVNFNHISHAEKAKEALNFVEVNGKPMRIMLSKRDPSMRKSGKGNVFVKNLDSSIDNKQLYDIFSTLGTVVSCKVARDACGVSKGHGFVQFNSESSVKEAIIHLHGAYVRNQYLHVSLFVSRRQWDESPVFTNVYVKNLSEITQTDADLRRIFEEFGEITSAVVMRDADGKSRGFGFVNFEKAEAAATAIEKMNGTVVDGKELYVGRAQRKKNRVEDLRAKFNREKIKLDVRLLKGLNLYVKNLEDSVNDEKLRELFSEFGNITSCKVMVHSNGIISKGFGFVEFSTSEEASNAVLKMNGKMVGRKPIYVSLAQRKEERRLDLETQFNNVRPESVVSPIPRQSPHQDNVPFKGYHFQPQLMFGSRFPNGSPAMPVPNFMVPQPFPFQRPPLYPPPPPLSWLQPVMSLQPLAYRD